MTTEVQTAEVQAIMPVGHDGKQVVYARRSGREDPQNELVNSTRN